MPAYVPSSRNLDAPSPGSSQCAATAVSIAHADHEGGTKCEKLRAMLNKTSVSSFFSLGAVGSAMSFAAVASIFGIFSLVSTTSIASVASVNSVASIASVNSVLSIGCVNGFLKHCFD